MTRSPRFLLVVAAAWLDFGKKPIQTQSVTEQMRQLQAPVPDSNLAILDEVPDEGLAPATVELDVSLTPTLPRPPGQCQPSSRLSPSNVQPKRLRRSKYSINWVEQLQYA
jgi:hypothetical protein